MAESLQAEATVERLIFKGKPKAMSAAIAVMVAGLLIFPMGMNQVFFVEAMAWTFIAWGSLLLFGHLIDYSTTYEVTEDALIVRSPLRFWSFGRTMDWGHIKRMNVLLSRIESTTEDATLQIIYTPEGSTQMIREDMPYDSQLAQEIVSRAGLKAAKDSGMTSFDDLPQDSKGQFSWQ
ncbi:MAG: hypothetical protein KF753_04480 [Caldilineaceae bacterium]|nr:hypothetical protein [Caldilineaceae bacterium]